MHERMKEHWHAICAAREGKSEPPPLGDYGFHNPIDYVINRCSMFITYGFLPRAGGIDDQDETFLADLETYSHGLALVAYERAEVERQTRLEEEAMRGKT